MKKPSASRRLPAIPRQAGSLEHAFVKARIKTRLLGQPQTASIGRFELLRRLGQGGEGTVYEARDLHGGARVALKQLHWHHPGSDASLKREFRVLADLVHPNLVAMHELFCVGGKWFYTMELVEGVDFVCHARKAGATCHDTLRAALSQLLTGLEALHVAGKIHCDLKPSNVLVRPDGRVVILDYGMVIDQTSPLARTERDGMAGTPAYAAPEQLRGRAEPASDLYAVGVMLYEALTGALPNVGSTSTLLSEKRRGATPNITQLPGDVPPALAALCAGLLSEQPVARPSLRAALASCDAQEGDSAHDLPGAAGSEHFVGRRALLSELHALLDARGTAPLLVLLRGESGIGKSAVLRRFCEERAQRGAVVLQGRCYEREHLPYKVMDALVEPLVKQLNALSESARPLVTEVQRDALVRVFPDFSGLRSGCASTLPSLPRDEAAALRAHAFAAVKTLLQALCRAREVVFAVDDLQWGDLDSIALLSHVLTGSEAPPLVLVAVYRAEERLTSPVIQALERGDALRREQLRRVELMVEPLSPEEASELLGALAPVHGPLSARQRDACIAQASGAPFALQQLAEHARDADLARADETRLADVVRARARRCSSGAQRLLRLLCVAGRPLETQLALRDGELAQAGWSEAVELCGRKLARWRDTDHERCLEPYHDLVRAAVMESVAAHEARAIHAAIVAALEALTPARSEHLVEHLLGAEQHERAGEMALVAADRAAAQLAWNRAVELLQIALRTLAPARLRAHGTAEKLALALASASAHREAARAYLEAAREHAEPRERRRLQSIAAQQQLRAGDDTAGLVLLRGLLRDVGYRLPRGPLASLMLWVLQRLRGRLDAWLRRMPRSSQRTPASEDRMQVLMAAHSELSVRRPLYGSVVHSWALREARKARDHHLLHALVREAAFLAVRYGPRQAARTQRLLHTVDALLPLSATPQERANRLLAHAVHALETRWRPGEALAWCSEADALLARECPGSEFERAWLWGLRGFALELAGECGVLRDETVAYLREAQGHDDAYSRDMWLMAMPWMYLLDGDANSAIEFTHAHWTLPRSTLSMVDYTMLVRLSSAYLYKGDLERCHAVLLDAWGALKRSGMMQLHVVAQNASFHRARNAAALYAVTRASSLKRDALRRVARARSAPPLLRAFYRLVDASIARTDGRDGDCRGALLAAIEDSGPAGGGATEWAARYRLAQLDRHPERLAAADAWLRARGVSDPARWVALSAPGDDWVHGEV